MASYKYTQHLNQSYDTVFDSSYGPGETTPTSGIYRCSGCGREIASNQGNPFPPQNHHQHASWQGNIVWKLNVRAD